MEFASSFEVLIRLVDRIPLRTHFERIEGDDTVEVARMSLKRLMRKKYTGHEGAVDQSGEALPARTWEILPVSALELAPEWAGVAEEPGSPTSPAGQPEGTKEVPSAAEDVGELLDVESFRSPVHKALFKQRNHFFDAYAAAFRATSLRRLEQLRAVRMKEEVGDQNWKSMLTQLTKEEEEAPADPS